MKRRVLKILKVLFEAYLAIVAILIVFKAVRPYLPSFSREIILAIIIVISAPIIGLIAFIAYRILKVRQQSKKARAAIWKRIAPLYDAIESHRGINEDDVRPFAKDLATRSATIQMLREYGLLELFPPELYTIEQVAMGYLATWLEFPTELDSLPSEIEHVERVTIDFDDEGNKVFYHVFKFRIDEPHWAASNGWMLGVVGPYFEDSKPEHHPMATFSRLDRTFGENTPESEALWVHENISLRN